MKTLSPAWFILSGAASLAAFAAQSTNDSGREIIGRLPAEPDVVLEWNAAINDHFEEFSLASTPQIQARVYAMVHVGMRDALAAATREARRDTTGAVAKSAASTAAHDLLVALCPSGVSRFAPVQTRHVTALANDAAAAQGRQIGQRIVASILRSRAADGWPVALSRSTAEKAAIESLRRPAAKPVPFVLKRVEQFEPEPPFFFYSDGVIMPNSKLQSKNLIGIPIDVMSSGRDIELWNNDAVVRWNQAAQSIAVRQPPNLHAGARLFASLNTALADALLVAMYWSETYRSGHVEPPVGLARANEAFHRGVDDADLSRQELIKIESSSPMPELRDMPVHPAKVWWVANPLRCFPAIPATLAGAAEAILRSSFGANAVIALPAKASDPGVQTDSTNLRTAARQCAWSARIAGTATDEGCIAGYELGNRIGAHVLKQDRR